MEAFGGEAWLLNGSPITAFTNDDKFCLLVTNKGNVIPEETIDKLFQPFYRGDDKTGKKGLRLGLYIASEIAKAHGVELVDDSTEELTCFRLQMPIYILRIKNIS